MKYDKSIKQLIKKRRSVRTFSERKIGDEERLILTHTMNELNDKNFRFMIMDIDIKEGTKLGTYGVIKGASTYILGIMKKAHGDDKDMSLKFGYSFEEIILKASDLSLGTCWMAGTFNKKHVDNLMHVSDDEQIVMIAPIGYEKAKSVTEKISRFFAKSDQRKAWDELFFDGEFSKPLVTSRAGVYKDALEMLRLSPSAVNLQPWRVVKTNTGYDFYIVKSKSTDKKDKKINISYNDIGIAKYHFEHTLLEDGVKGSWILKDEEILMHEKYEYVCSWK